MKLCAIMNMQDKSRHWLAPVAAWNNTNGLFDVRERKVIISHFVAFVNCRWRKDVPKWLFLI